MGLHASVKEHLNALEEAPEWVVSLGEMIQRAEECSAAIAASRARDLSQRKDIGRAIEGIARGWEVLSACDLASLTPLQRETIEALVLSITKELETGILQAGRIDQ
jgi:hypothetical protein